MAHRNPQKGGVKKKSNRMKPFARLGLGPDQTALNLRNFYDPIVNRKMKEILKQNNRL